MDLLEILGRIGFDWQVALANLVNFLIIFWILKRFVFERIQKAIDERRERISKGVADAREAEVKLSEAETEKESILAEAKKEAHSIIEKARAEEEKIVEGAKMRASEESGEVVRKGEKELLRKAEEMEYGFRQKASGIVIKSVEKILGRELEGEKAKRYEEDMMKSI